VQLIALDSAAMLRATGPGEGWPAFLLIDGAAHQMLTELVPDAPDSWTPEGRHAACRAFDEQWQVVAEEHPATVGIEQARRRYLDDRSGWESKVRSLAAAMLYRWEDIEPTGNSQGRP
jgi:hypothetical protein